MEGNVAASDSVSFKRLCERIENLVNDCQSSLRSDDVTLQFQHNLRSVQRTIKRFNSVVKESLKDIDDRDTKSSIEKACNRLEEHLNCLITLSQKTRTSKLGKELEGELVFNFEGILRALQEVLFHINEAEIHAICDLAQNILRNLSGLESSKDSAQLLDNFKDFTKDLVTFSNQVVWKLQLISDDGLTDRTFDILTRLKQLIGMFSSSSIQALKDENDTEAKMWRSYAISEITKALKEIISMLHSYTDYFRKALTHVPSRPETYYFSCVVDVKKEEQSQAPTCLQGETKCNGRIPSATKLGEESFVDSDRTVVSGKESAYVFDSSSVSQSTQIKSSTETSRSKRYPQKSPSFENEDEIKKKDIARMKRILSKYVEDFDHAARLLSDDNHSDSIVTFTNASQNLLEHMKFMKTKMDNVVDNPNDTLLGVLDAHSKEDYSQLELQLNNVSKYMSCMRGIVISVTRNNYDMSVEASDLENKFLQLQEVTAQLFSYLRKHDSKTTDTMKHLAKMAGVWRNYRKELVELLRYQLVPWILIATEYRQRSNTAMSKELLTEKVLTYHNCIRRLRYLATSLGKQTDSNLGTMFWESTEARQKRLQNDLEVMENSEARWILSLMNKDCDIVYSNEELGILKWACAARDVYDICRKSLHGKDFDKWYSQDLTVYVKELMDISNGLLEWVSSDVDREDMLNLSTDLKVIYQRLGLDRKSAVDRQLDDTLLPLEAAAKKYELATMIDKFTRETDKPMKCFLETIKETPVGPTTESSERVMQAVSTLKKKVECVEIHAGLAVENAYERKDIHRVFTTLDDIKQLTSVITQAVENCPVTDIKYTSLKWYCRKWQMKAFVLVGLLRKLADVNMESVTSVMRHLHSGKDMYSISEFDGAILCPTSMSPDSKVQDLESSGFFDGSGSILELPSMPSLKIGDSTAIDEGIYSEDRAERESMCTTEESEATILYAPPLQSKTRILVNGEDFIHRKNIDRSPTSSPVIEREENEQQTVLADGFKGAAFALKQAVEAESGLDDSVVAVVKQMAEQMFQMAEFARGKGELKSRNDFIKTAKAIAMNATGIREHALGLAKQCKHTICKNDLIHYSEVLPTICTQLQVISSVKAASPEDESADVILVTNADNLMKAVVGTLKAIRAASVELKL